MKWLWIGIALALFWLTFRADAHDSVTGEPNWIEQHGYQGTDNIKCCGPNDCERLSDGEIEVRRDGFYLTRFKELVPFSEATPSEDASSWRCHKTYAREERRCFFYRYGAS